MTTTSGHRQRRFLLSLLTLLTLVGAIGLGPTIDASASTHPAAQTRVRAIDHRAPVSVAAVDLGSSTTVEVSSVRLRQLVSATGVATNTATSRTFGVADRVAGQLDDVRLGSLRGQLGPDDLQRLVNAPGAQRYYDTATGNINVIQQVDDVLLRITTASDEFKIISVGPIRPNQVTNGVTNGRFVPIGGAG